MTCLEVDNNLNWDDKKIDTFVFQIQLDIYHSTCLLSQIYTIIDNKSIWDFDKWNHLKVNSSILTTSKNNLKYLL